MPAEGQRGILKPMAYEITATRKRPQSFLELAGQEFVSATLKASIESGRIAHAYLFSGPRGCGKTSTARILAKSLNCERGPSASPCGACDSCLSIARGSALDVIEIDGASNTSVENIRQIKDEVLFPPNASKYKIYIIDEVHMLSNSAFNALLKTIEEPPPYIVFIFATTELHKVPATIKSRCQQFSFRLIPLDTIRERLAQAASDMGIKADEDALLWIAREATGSLRDAYTLFDQVAAFSDGHINAALIRDKLGLVGTERMAAMMRHCVAGDRQAALELLDSVLEGGVSVEQFTSDAVSYARALLLFASGVRREALLGLPLAAFPEEVTSAVDAPRLERMLADLFDLHRDMRYSVNPRWELELAVARLCSIKDYVTPAELARSVASVKEALAGGVPLAGVKAVAGPAQRKTSDSFKEAMGGAFANGSAQPGASAGERGTHLEARQEAQAPSMDRKPAGRQPAAVASDADALLDDEDGAPIAAAPGAIGGVAAEAGNLAELKKVVCASLAKQHVVLSMCLERTGPWHIEGDKVIIPCANGYDASTVLSDAAVVVKRLAETAGRPLKVEPRTPEIAQPQAESPRKPAGDDDEPESAPSDPVAIVERVFRGRRMGDDKPDKAGGDGV